jgi:hypothetical protein
MKWISLLALPMLCGLFVVAPSLGQQNTAALRMEQVMTQDELRSTGVEGLTQAQRVALDAWLNRYTSRLLTTASNNGTGAYGSVGGGHWITEKSDNGGFITLEDGSFWEINSIDRIDTALWLPVTNITVILSRSPIVDYKYELINTDDDEKALAKYMGKQ